MSTPKKKVLFLVPDDITFIVQRLVMAHGAQLGGFDVHVASEDTGVTKKLEEFGFTYHHQDLNRGGLNPFADFVPFIKLCQLFLNNRPDILQCVSIKPVIYGSIAARIVGQKNVVCLVNGLGFAFDGVGTKGKIVRQVAFFLYRLALSHKSLRVIFQNPDDRDFFIKNRLVAANKTILIRGSGVNMKKFIPTSAPVNPEPKVLFVGRLLWNKGVKELIGAARILKEKGLKFKLVIVGDPDERNPGAVPKSFLQELSQEGIIEWVGRQTNMPKFFSEADIICLPTQYKEGLPLTLLEAASVGRPLIATDVPGCREIVRNGVNGFLVPAKSVDELALAIEKLVQNNNLRAEFGSRSTQIVKEEFSSDIVQAQLVGLYRSLLIPN